MCGRYSLTTPAEALQRLFKFAGPLPNLPARYNIAPTQDVPVIRLEDGARRLAMLRWGLVPSWARAVNTAPLINARAETVAEKPSFRDAFARRHCLVPADGFYEWATHGPHEKQPFRFHRPGNAPFAFAGIWERWTGPEGEVQSAAIVSTEPNALLAEIHDRAPVIVMEDDWDRWLDAEGTGLEGSLGLLTPPPDGFLSRVAVSTALNRVREDGAHLWAEVTPQGPPPKPAAAPEPKAQLDLF